MHCSLRFHQRAHFPHWFSLLATGLIAALINPVAKAQVAAPESQAVEERTKADKAQERVFSGPQPGERVQPFKVLHVRADETKELEIVKEVPDEHTTLICFVHKLSNDDRILYGLGLVDFYAARHTDLTSHYVLLSDDRPKMTNMLRAWTRGPLFTNSLLSLSDDGVEGPGAYGLNRKVAMTVVVAKGDRVVSNLVFNAPNNNDLQKIMAAVAKANGKPEPKLATVQQELRAERQRQVDKRIKASPVFKLAPNELLGRIMYGMVHARGNRSRNASRRSKQLLDWAGDSEERQSALKKYCKAVLDGNFKPDRYSLAAIKKIAE